MHKKVNMKENYEKKISSFIINAGSECILVPEDNEKQNPEETYTDKYQKHIACSYDYKLVFVDNKFTKLFTTYLGKEAVCNFINNKKSYLKKVNIAVT